MSFYLTAETGERWYFFDSTADEIIHSTENKIYFGETPIKPPIICGRLLWNVPPPLLLGNNRSSFNEFYVYAPTDRPFFDCPFFQKRIDTAGQLTLLRKATLLLSPLTVIAAAGAIEDPLHYTELIEPFCKKIVMLA